MKKYILPLYLGLHKLWMKLCWNLFIHFPLDKKKVVFSNFNGGGYGDNPKFIAEEFLRRDSGFQLYWVAASPDYVFPAGIRPVRPNTAAFAYHMATAAFWVDNTRKLYYFKKRPEQYYIQTWHGGPGLKKVEMDCESALSKEYIAWAKNDSRYIDLFLSCCKWCSDLYHRSFWYNGALLEKGIPKNDMYFEDQAPYQEKVRSYFHLPADVRLVMYAPTYRDNRKTDMYNLNYEMLRETLSKRFGGEWAVLVRLHPNVNYHDYPITYTNRIVNASPYENMQELLAATDVIISDYSGCAFDFLTLDRPGFLYAEDYEEIRRTKDYYFSLEELPFTLAFSNQELMDHILHFDEDLYAKKCQIYREQIQYFDTGHAAEAVVDVMVERSKK